MRPTLAEAIRTWQPADREQRAAADKALRERACPPEQIAARRAQLARQLGIAGEEAGQ